MENRNALHGLAGLAPGSQRRGRNRAGRLFCVIARNVGRSVDKALGGFYRRLKGRRGGLVANLALARKLADLFWRPIVHEIGYVEQGLKENEAQVEAKPDSYPTAGISGKLPDRLVHCHDVLRRNFRKDVMHGVEYKSAAGHKDFQPALHVFFDLGRRALG